MNEFNVNRVLARIAAVSLAMLSGYIFRDSGFVDTIVGSVSIITAYELFRV